ncbi:hypothetical protein Tco_1351078 [Tanacetum coccineum]
MLFDKEMKRVNTFVDMDTELVKGSKTRTERSSKRAREELESKNLKKQKLDKNVEAEVDDDQEEAEMKKHMEIVPDDDVFGLKDKKNDVVKKKDVVPRKKRSFTTADNILPDPDEAVKLAESISLIEAIHQEKEL